MDHLVLLLATFLLPVSVRCVPVLLLARARGLAARLHQSLVMQVESFHLPHSFVSEALGVVLLCVHREVVDRLRVCRMVLHVLLVNSLHHI